LCRVQREHVRVRGASGEVDCGGSGYDICFVYDPVVYSEKDGAGRVEVVHGYYVFVIVGPGNRLVRKTPRIRDRVEVEGACGIVSCGDGEDDSCTGDIDD